MQVDFDVLAFASKEWTSHRQRPHWVADELALLGARVLFVENVGVRLPRLRESARVTAKLQHWARTSARSQPVEVHHNLRIDAPLVPPLQHRRLIRTSAAAVLARRLRRRLNRDRPLVVWTYLPMPVIRDVTRRLDAALLVYDWADDASAHVLTRSGAHRRRLAGWEDEMAAAADVTFLSSAELMRRRGAVCRHAVLMPHGAPVVPADAEPPPAQRREHLGKPRIGFVGSITEFTDLPLVEGLARARPDWSFVLVGPARVSVKALASLPNVTLVGAVPHPEVLALLPSLDAAIIPYHVTPATEAASPVKVHEYLAFGLPVVSVDIPEVRDLEPGVAVATGTEGFLAALDDAVCRGRQPPATGGQRASWAEQVETMAAHVTLALEASHARI